MIGAEQQKGQRGADGEDHEEGRQQPPRPPDVKIREGKFPCDKIRPDKSRNQIAAEHEEHIDAGKPTMDLRQPKMEGHNPADGDRAKSVELRFVTERSSSVHAA